MVKHGKYQKKVVAVITTYNRLAKLKKSLTKTLKQDFLGVIIVNNNSNDGTTKWLESYKLKDTRIKVLNLKENIGGAGGFYHGFKAAVSEFDADWLVCFDDDAYPKARMLDKFNQLNLSENVGGVCAAVYLPDGDICEMNRPSVNPFNKGVFSIIKGFFSRSSYHVTNQDYKNKQDDYKSCNFCSFVGCFIKVSSIKKGLGYPKKDFFIYADDLDYTSRLNALGKDLIFVPELVFLHDQTRKNQRSKLPLWRVFYFIRNNLLFYKSISGKFYFLVVFYKIFIWLFKFKRYALGFRFYLVLYCAVADAIQGKLTRSHDSVLKLSGHKNT